MRKGIFLIVILTQLIMASCANLPGNDKGYNQCVLSREDFAEPVWGNAPAKVGSGDIDLSSVEEKMEERLSSMYEGIAYERELKDSPRGMVIHKVTVDLEAEGIEFFVTPRDTTPSDESKCVDSYYMKENCYKEVCQPLDCYTLRSRTTSEFLDEYDLQLAINADAFFPWQGSKALKTYPRSCDPVQPLDFAASGGDVYSPVRSNEPIFLVGKDGSARITNGSSITSKSEIGHAVSGFNTIVAEGRIPEHIYAIDDNNPTMDPRTAIGLDKEGKRMFIIIVDGRSDESKGCMIGEVAQMMLDMGAYFAINMDGGGSSTLVMENEDGVPEIINTPIGYRYDKMERPVANHLGIYAKKRQVGKAKEEKTDEDSAPAVVEPITYRVEPTESTREGAEDEPGAIQVGQRMYAITSPQRERFLQSWGAGPCVILTLYDKDMGIGMMTHIDAETLIEESIETISGEMASLGVSDMSSVEARLFGGEEGSSEDEVRRILASLGDKGIRVVEQDILHYGFVRQASVQMDTSTGQVFDYSEETSFPRKCPYCINEDATALCTRDEARLGFKPKEPIGDPWVYRFNGEGPWKLGDTGDDKGEYRDCYMFGAGLNEEENPWKCQCHDDWNLQPPTELDLKIEELDRRISELIYMEDGFSPVFAHPQSMASQEMASD